jgi:hypothetical protein
VAPHVASINWIHLAFWEVLQLAPPSLVSLQIAPLPPTTLVVPVTTQLESLVQAMESAVASRAHFTGCGELQLAPAESVKLIRAWPSTPVSIAAQRDEAKQLRALIPSPELGARTALIVFASALDHTTLPALFEPPNRHFVRQQLTAFMEVEGAFGVATVCHDWPRTDAWAAAFGAISNPVVPRAKQIPASSQPTAFKGTEMLSDGEPNSVGDADGPPHAANKSAPTSEAPATRRLRMAPW